MLKISKLRQQHGPGIVIRFSKPQEDVDGLIDLAECFVGKYGLVVLPKYGKYNVFLYPLVPDFNELFNKQVEHKSNNYTLVLADVNQQYYNLYDNILLNKLY